MRNDGTDCTLKTMLSTVSPAATLIVWAAARSIVPGQYVVVFAVPFAVSATAGPPKAMPPTGHGGDDVLAGRQAGDAELAEVVGRLAAAGRRKHPAGSRLVASRRVDATHRHDARVGDRFTRRVEELAGDHGAFLEVESDHGDLAGADLRRRRSAAVLDQRREAGFLRVKAELPGASRSKTKRPSWSVSV